MIAKEATAYHEAGHTVVALEQRCTIRRVSLLPRRRRIDGRLINTLGFTYCYLPLHLSDSAMLRAKAVQALAGPCAEARYLELRAWGEDVIHYEEAIALDLAVEAMGKGEPGLTWLGKRRNETRRLIGRHWSLVHVIAKALLERRSLDGEALRSLATEAGWQDPEERRLARWRRKMKREMAWRWKDAEEAD